MVTTPRNHTPKRREVAMRLKRTTQMSLYEPKPVDHPLGRELETVSNWLDAHPELLEEVAADLGAQSERGRGGLTCESILRCAVLKHLRGETWRGLAFALVDSVSACRFARVDPLAPPKKSALQAAVGGVTAETWERVNRCLLGAAREAGVETGERVRVDSTVTETHILAPTDSRLLYDGVRVLADLLLRARERLGKAAVPCRDRRRAARRRCLAVRTKRGKAARAKLYRELLRIAVATLGDLEAARPAVTESGAPWSANWLECADHYAGLLKAVVVQSARRVLLEENVPAGEKIVSLFEPHTDIIRKGGRATAYGHKINLATGRSGLVLDVVVESGNPADSARCLPMLERHRAHYGGPPTHAAFDGGYASRANLEGAREMGVAHAVFSKRRGLKEEDMTPSPWIFERLRRFRAGVEAGISWLKRCFGLGRCRWRGLPRFRAWVHSAVFAHNLVRIARLRPG